MSPHPTSALRFLLLLLVLCTPLAAWAGTTGKIAGRVVDVVSGEPLPGVNVVIAGTTQGTTTDLDGYYQILKVQPGTYAVQASFIGFATTIVENVQVIVDKTTTINFDLREEVVQGEEIVVTAERPIVQVDRTTTTAVVDGEQLEALPVTSIGDAINLQAGIVADPDGKLHFRGGRSGEVAYLVNGVPINNSFSKEASFEVEQNMVSSLEVISGVFNAEYGQATSGVVNIVTKDVPDQWSGSFLGYIGAIVSNREIEFLERTAPAGGGLGTDDFVPQRVTFSEAADFPNLTDVQVSLGGPILKDRLGIRASVRYLNDKSHLIGRDLFSPSDSSQGLNSGLPRELWTIESTGDGDFFALNTTERVSVNATAGYNFSPRVKLDYNVFIQDGEYLRYDHFRKYVPRGINTISFFNQTHILGLRLTLGDRAFANVSYSYLNDQTDNQLYAEPTDPRYVSSDLNQLQGANAFAVAGNDLSTSYDQIQTHTLVVDYTRQWNRIHLMKAGLQMRLHSIDNRNFGIERSFRTGFQPQPSPDRFNNNALTSNPKEFAAYVQDKMEFTGLIVNAGMRVDYFDPDYVIPLEWTEAQFEEIADPNNPGQSISNREQADPQLQVSPRLGIAFPISSTGVMRFSAGLFFQIPPFGLLYTNPEFEVNPASSSNQFGNAAIDPERTLAFEVGLQQGLTEDVGLELTIFSKDVRNLTGQEIVRNPNGDFSVRWINRDYGTIRGLTLALFQRPTGGKLSWTLDYTLQFAEGTASFPGEAFEREQAGLDPILSLVRLNWDRRHVLNNTLTLSPIPDLTITFINRLQSGQPYTTVRDFVPSLQKNNASKPMLFSSDMRLFYRPPFIKQDVQLFLQVTNLTDTEQQVNVYASTGRADQSVDLELFRRQGTAVGGVNTLDEWFFRQEFFGAPRKISLGLNYKF